MELKTPVKKGFKTPRNRPPLPIIHESSSGLCLDEYDWPLFNGYFNGTSVIIDDPRGIFLLSNKGFFGKGSLSKGCPNLSKRKLLSSVIYESQWKRRKQWMESLNKLLKNKDISAKTDRPVINSNEEKISCINDDNEAIKTNEMHKLSISSEKQNLNEKVVDSSNNTNKESLSNDESKPHETLIVEPLTIDQEIFNTNKNEEVLDDNVSKDNNCIKTPPVIPEPQDVKSLHLPKAVERKSNMEKEILGPNEVLVISDVGSDLDQYFLNLNPHIEDENVKTAIEVLYLSLEEAFFLTYVCNCLQVVDLSSNILKIKDMWNLFQTSQADFIEKYVAYHYFRAKGWVVKSGTKFGGDFLLYKKGPLYFHASYIVIVEVLMDGESVKNKLTWQKIIGMNRMAETATKEVLICHISWPDVGRDDFNDTSILKDFKVSETLLRRWQPTQEKSVPTEKQ